MGVEPPEVAAGFVRVPGYGAHLAATSDPARTDEHRVERQRFAPPGFADAAAGFDPLESGETPHWRVSLNVADRDAAASTIIAEGGSVESTGDDRWTRHATVVDPVGAHFSISQFAPRS